MSVSRQPGGILVFDGYAPDVATRDRFQNIEGADTTWLKLAGGEPAGYRTATDFGLALLETLSEGRFALRGNVITISGIAASKGAYQTAQELLTKKAPAGLIIAMAEIRPPAGAPAAELSKTWSLTKSTAGAVEISGPMPSVTLQSELAQRLGSRVVDNTTVTANLPADFAQQVNRAVEILDLLSEGSVTFDGTEWSASGVGISGNAVREVAAILGAAAASWKVSVTAPVAAIETEEPNASVVESDGAGAEAQTATATSEAAIATTDEPPESVESAVAANAAQEAPTATARPGSSPSNLAQCRAEVDALSAQNAILFRSGAAVLDASAGAVLDSFAASLALCPEAIVYVEGHTDSDGDDRLNLILSVSRAEAVVNALVDRGVAAERLYAIGYGEAQPVASNATSDGKRQNRRIVVSVRDSHD